MASKTKSYTVRCDACSFTATATSEDQARFIALQHVGTVHRDANEAHMLGQHIHIETSGGEEATA